MFIRGGLSIVVPNFTQPQTTLVRAKDKLINNAQVAN